MPPSDLRPSEAQRCTVCGASRLMKNGRPGACSLVPGGDGQGGCPDPLHDVRQEEASRPASARSDSDVSWSAVQQKARQLEEEIRKAVERPTSLLHTLSKLTMFAKDAVDFARYEGRRSASAQGLAEADVKPLLEYVKFRAVRACVERLEKMAADYRYRATRVFEEETADTEAADAEAEELELSGTVAERCANKLRPMLRDAPGPSEARSELIEAIEATPQSELDALSDLDEQDAVFDCVICQARPSTEETYADAPGRTEAKVEWPLPDPKPEGWRKRAREWLAGEGWESAIDSDLESDLVALLEEVYEAGARCRERARK